jgi:hypothetical protein
LKLIVESVFKEFVFLLLKHLYNFIPFIEKMIEFVLMVNKQGQTRMAQYFNWYPIQERVALEAEV